MPEKPRPDIESFANLVSEGLKPDVFQPASYWTAAFKANEGFRKTVLCTPFQTLGVYLIANAHEKNGEGDNFIFENATRGFATMIGLKACDRTYKEFTRQSLDPPKYGDVLNVIPHVLDMGHTDKESAKYMRLLWHVDTPPKPEQIARLTILDEFMQLFGESAQQYLGKEILFTHGLEAMQMGATPDSIDTIISDSPNMHYFRTAIGNCVAKIQGHVRDFYTPEKAPMLNEESFSADDSALLQQHAHHLLLTRNDMKAVEKLAKAESHYTTEDIIGYMNQVFNDQRS